MCVCSGHFPGFIDTVDLSICDNAPVDGTLEQVKAAVFPVPANGHVMNRFAAGGNVKGLLGDGRPRQNVGSIKSGTGTVNGRSFQRPRRLRSARPFRRGSGLVTSKRAMTSAASGCVNTAVVLPPGERARFSGWRTLTWRPSARWIAKG